MDSLILTYPEVYEYIAGIIILSIICGFTIYKLTTRETENADLDFFMFMGIFIASSVSLVVVMSNFVIRLFIAFIYFICNPNTYMVFGG